MATEEKKFSLTADNTKCNITVGYISSERGFVDGVGVYEANHIAKLNPGTQFIFRNRDFVKYLNINEVNALTPDEMLPEKRSGAGSCSGIVGLNLEGDTSKSIDADLGADPAYTGGTTQSPNVAPETNKTKVDFYGGGGVGVQAAPIIGIDGSILAVQVLNGGYGYKYPPIVDIHDDTGKGAGVVARSVIKTRSSDDPVLVEEFDAEEDYEEYVLDKCVPEMEKIGYGQRWDADGKNLGKWDPMVYFTKSADPIRYEIQRYQKFLANLKDGTRIDGDRIKEWWTTRHKSPLRIVSADKIAREKFDVQHPAWGGLVTIQPNPLPHTTSSTFGVATSLIESSFLVYTSGGHRRDLKFIFKEKSGDHRFEIRADDYKNNASAEEIKIKVRRNTKYTVTTTSKKGIRDEGLLKKGTFGTGGDIAQRSGTSNAIFSDIGKSAPDDDDLQVQCKQGVFSIDNKNITYELKDSAAYNAEKNSMYGEGLKDNKNTITTDSFMNQYAVSPVPPSNVKGSDHAGKNYILEWEEEFPWDGTYVFNIQADNEAHLFLDNDPIGEKVLLGAGGAAGHVLSPPQKFQKFVKGGMHKVTIDLLNHQIREMKKIQTDVVATSDEVNFNITISTMFETGITIEGLGIDVSKPYDEGTSPLKETLTKKVEYGRVYPVKIRSSGFKQETSSSTVVNFTGLNASNNPINVTNDGTRLALKDGSGGDTNASFTIQNVSGGTAKFSTDGKGIDVKGDNVQIQLTLSWNDRPSTAGVAVGTIKIGDKVWTQSGRSGSQTHTVTLSSSSSGSGNSSTIKLKTKGEKVIAMEDLPGQDAGDAGVGFFDDLICSVNNGRFFGISGSSCSFIVDPPENGDGSSLTKRGERAHVFNTVDWITRANRRLWKMNPSHHGWKDADFVNRFGVLPFDPTEVPKIEKKRKRDITIESKATVNFFKEADGRNYMKVTGTGRVKVFFEMNINDRPGISSLALTEIKINADDNEITLRRDPNRRYANEKASGEFTAGQKYLVKTIGASSGSGSIIGSDKTTIGYDDDIYNGYDQNGLLRITAINPINITKTIDETVMGYPDYPNASTDDYAGFHEIIWNNLVFPEDGNYSISTMVDDNVVLTFSRPNQQDIILDKKGFQIRGDHRTGTGKSTEIKYFKAGSYTLKAVLEQIPGAPLAHGNPMVLALDIKAAFLTDEIEVISSKSWNENPMGVAMSIDAPMAPKIDEPPQQQEGRCPNNPIWTTRSSDSSDKTWYPVNVDFWAKFMNRYAISPLPPLGLKGTDGAGTVYRNSWKVELPYRGFYGVKGTADDFGKLFIDGVEVLGPDVDKKFDNYDNAAPKAKKILLEKKTVDITVEIENKKDFIWHTIDQKVFSTADWASKQTKTETTIEGPKSIDVAFKLNIGTMYGAGIKLFDGNTVLFDDYKGYKQPSISETHNHNIEVGKVYDVEFTSSNTNISATSNGIEFTGLNASNNPINVTNDGTRLALKDGSGGDTNASFTIDNVLNGNVNFAADGRSFVVKGSNVKVTLTLSWNDRPSTAGVALNSIKIGSTIWTQSGRSGNVTHTITLSDGKSGIIRNDGSNNSNIKIRNKGKNVVEMEDIPQDFSAGTGGTNDEALWYKDIVCSATDGEFYNIQGRKCKYRIPSKDKTEIVYGKGLTSGSSKGGVTYDGPPLSTYATGTLGPFITPTWTTDEDYIANFNGKTWTMTWNDVDFPEKGTYDIQAEADDKLIIKLDGVEITTAEVGSGISKTQFTAPKGKRKIELTLTNLDFNAPFKTNPTVAAVKITRKVQVAKVDPKSGTALGKPWTANPIGVSAILIPPPCPKKINGVGIVTDVIITDPGNGFDPPIREVDPTVPTGPPVIMEVEKIIPEDEGINYGPDDKVCIVNTETGEEVCFIPPKPPFGGIPEFDPRKTPPAPPGPPDPTPEIDPPPPTRPDVGITAIPSVIVKGDCTNLIYTSARNTSLKIDQGVGDVPVVSRGEVKVCPTVTTTYTIEGDEDDATTVVTVVEDPNDPLLDSPPAPPLPPAPNGYRTYPKIIVRGRGTGIGYKGIPVMKAVIDPIGVDPNRLIQVTDLPGLKQTGYYDGKPYYGAVFYENGIRYAGYYDTPGQKVQIYDTMQESIDATVTTPPSAIQRSGTDTNSNNPRLNIPGTPDNLA